MENSNKLQNTKMLFTSEPPKDGCRFVITWKWWEFSGTISNDVRTLTQEEIISLEDRFRDEIKQEIIEHCLDQCLTDSKRYRLEKSLIGNLMENGNVKWYDNETDEQIPTTTRYEDKWGCFYSCFK